MLSYPNLIKTARSLQIIATAIKSNNHNYLNTVTMLFSNHENRELHVVINKTARTMLYGKKECMNGRFAVGGVVT